MIGVSEYNLIFKKISGVFEKTFSKTLDFFYFYGIIYRTGNSHADACQQGGRFIEFAYCVDKNKGTAEVLT